MKEVYKRWGFDTDDNNLSDAFAMAQIGRAYLGSMDKLTTFQQVIDSLQGKQKAKPRKKQEGGRVMNQARFDDCLERADIVQMLTDTRVCLNCGKRLPRGHEFKRKTGYCNQFCYFEKPPKMAFLEHQYGEVCQRCDYRNAESYK